MIWKTYSFNLDWDQTCTEIAIGMYRTGRTHIDIVQKDAVRSRIKAFIAGCEALMKPKKHPTRER